MMHSKQGISPESLPSVIKLVASQREQKGNGKKTVVVINQAIKSAKAQIEHLEKLKRHYKV